MNLKWIVPSMTGLAALMIAMALFSGTAQRDRLAVLEKRCAEIERKAVNLAEFADGLKEIIVKYGGETQTNLALLKVLMLENQQKANGISAAVLPWLEAESKRQSVVAKSAPARGVTPAQYAAILAAKFVDGVPVEVHKSIVAEAIKDWPRDYALQETWIRMQVTAYKKLHQ
jgi:hypothetical protein